MRSTSPVGPNLLDSRGRTGWTTSSLELTVPATILITVSATIIVVLTTGIWIETNTVLISKITTKHLLTHVNE